MRVEYKVALVLAGLILVSVMRVWLMFDEPACNPAEPTIWCGNELTRGRG